MPRDSIRRYGFRPIGFVKTSFTEDEIRKERKRVVSEIVLRDELTEGLEGIDEYSHIFVIFWMHEVPRPERRRLRIRPRGREDLEPVGVFVARSRGHPNPVGLAVVELLGRSGGSLKVRGLDAIDGTPVIDLKPYDYYDMVERPRVPLWWLRLYSERHGNRTLGPLGSSKGAHE